MTQGGPRSAAGVREGDVLAGKYRVERVLGVGGMGVVVAAHHLQLDTKVALKFLLPTMLANREAVGRFAREARAAVKITSEHVARVLDVGTLDTGAPYMVMEYLEGGDLAAWLQQRGPLPIEQAVEFVLQACVAVAEAHGLGIVHRDLKPANLFCVRRPDGQLSVKVLDFGISKATDLAISGPTGSVTSTGAIMGSPLYMSPEQMQSPKGVDASTDIWALGVVLFELLTRRVPFDGETFGEIAVKVATQPPPPMRDFRPDIPGGLEAAIRKCLKPDRRDRYRNVAELALALLPFAPKRARASVERISGIIQASGLSVSALDLPPSPAAQGALAVSGTIAPVGGTAPGLSPRGRVAVAGVAGTLAVMGALAIVSLRPKGEAARGDDPRAAASGASSVLDASKPPEVQPPPGTNPVLDTPPAASTATAAMAPTAAPTPSVHLRPPPSSPPSPPATATPTPPPTTVPVHPPQPPNPTLRPTAGPSNPLDLPMK